MCHYKYSILVYHCKYTILNRHMSNSSSRHQPCTIIAPLLHALNRHHRHPVSNGVCSLLQDVWHGRGPGWQRLRRGGEGWRALDRGRGEDAAPSHGPQRGQRVGQPQGQVRLFGIRRSAHPVESVCRLRQCCTPGRGLRRSALTCTVAALRGFSLPLQGELSPKHWGQ